MGLLFCPAAVVQAGAVWRGNEPAGFTTIGERAFDEVDDDPVWDDQDLGPLTFTTDATAPKSPPNIAQAFYAQGSSGGTGRGASVVAGYGNNYREFYACYWIKYSDNYQGHDSSNNKNVILYSQGAAFVASLVFENICTGAGPMTPKFIGQDLVVPNSSEYDGWDPNVGDTTRKYIRGQWHLQEWHVVGNTNGNADGEIRWWLDGDMLGEYTGLQFNNGATHWTQFSLLSVWGGIGDTVDEDMSLNFDHCYISAKL